MSPVLRGTGRRATPRLCLRRISGPVYPHSRAVRASAAMVRLGTAAICIRLVVVLNGPAGAQVLFDQSPLTIAAD